jgi:hypothetical protein
MGELGVDAVNVSQSAVRFLNAGHATVERSAIQTLRAEEAEVEHSMLLAASGPELEVEDSVVGVVVGREVEVEQSRVFLLAAPVVKGDVRALIDMRSMLAFGAGFAVMGYLLRGLSRLAFGRN